MSLGSVLQFKSSAVKKGSAHASKNCLQSSANVAPPEVIITDCSNPRAITSSIPTAISDRVSAVCHTELPPVDMPVTPPNRTGQQPQSPDAAGHRYRSHTASGGAVQQPTGVNVYARPQRQSEDSPIMSPQKPGDAPPASPRRGSLFGSLRAKDRAASPVQEGGGLGEPYSAISPAKRAGLLPDSWRPRSKSDSRHSKPNIGRSSAGTMPPTEELYVDTQLANKGGTTGPYSAGADRRFKSPVAQAVDWLKKERRQSTSAGQASADAPSPRKVSGSGDMPFNAGASTPQKSPPAGKVPPLGGLTPTGGPSAAHSKLITQHSLDNALSPSGGVTSPNAAIIYRDGGQHFFLGGALNALMVSNLEDENLVFTQFMKAHKCYDLIPTSSKLVVFDTQLSVKKAFFALVYNGVRAAPLWDSSRQEFIGMLTITDFINILRKYYKSAAGISQELEEHKICTWKDSFNDSKQLISIDPSDSLYTAVLKLCSQKVHRLPVVNRDTGNVLYILTHKRILRFLYLYIHDLPRPAYLNKTPKELGIGTWDRSKIITVQQTTPLIEALNKFMAHRVSALPVLDAQERVVDIYAKFDVINLAGDKAYNDLNITVADALKHRQEWFEGVQTCTVKDSVLTVMDTIVKAEVHRLVIVDEQKKINGLVSLSDLLYFLILRPASIEEEENE